MESVTWNREDIFCMGGNAFVADAYEYAVKCHLDTNHKYDGHSYEKHLKHVFLFANKYRHLIPIDDIYIVFSASSCHDTIEDTRITWNDLRKATNEQVADIVYAVSNEKGKTRKERANAKYYRGIRKTPYAVFVKLCDRLANAQYSYEKYLKIVVENKAAPDSMFAKYRKENNDFLWQLLKPEWYRLDLWLYRITISKASFLEFRILESPYYVMIKELKNILSK